MPSRKKKSKAKGRKPAAGKGGGAKGTDNAAANEGALDSEMQRLKIGEQKGDEDDVEAMLEEAIKLAAIEEQEMKVKEKENCTHGYNPSSIFQARYCEDFMKTFTESYHASASTRGNGRLNSFMVALDTAVATSTKTTNTSKNLSNVERVSLFCLAEGTKYILDGNYDDARLSAVVASLTKGVSGDELIPDPQKILEMNGGDEHTLVQFFRKRIPCSCLDEKYKEVKSITKMGICLNEGCPLPGNMVIRSKMVYCTRCVSGRIVSYCSRECQKADWPDHKKYCGLTTQEILAMHPNE